mmetsp:Transcript_25830/g.53842  ORF Transcript_25830/g.53842 Transcript_25830/m.53842 type:complete len:146 (+) Transcript_25830:242-679(+)
MYPKVRIFLKGGYPELYQNVSMTWKEGHDPVLFIYKNGEEQEKIRLAEHDDMEQLEALMLEKGFKFKSEEEMQKIMEEREAMAHARREERERERQFNILKRQKLIDKERAQGIDSKTLLLKHREERDQQRKEAAEKAAAQGRDEL